MKKIFLTGFLLLIFATHGIAQSEWMKTVIDNIPVTAPPSSDITKQRRAAYNVPGEDRGFPDYTYKDFQRNQRITYKDPDRETDCTAYCQFRKPGNSEFTILGISIDEGDYRDILLATYEFDGSPIDWVDVEVKFGDIKLKQYKITPEMKLFVYELKPTSPTPIYFYEDYIQKKISSLNAQRIDTVYRIDDDGKVNKLSEKKYQPKDYSMTILETADIWNGNETPLQ